MFSLFDDGAAPEEQPPRPVLMSESQRARIRALFADLGVATAREQFKTVAETTGVRISSVAELEATTAQTLISRLESRVASRGSANTGNSWDDREEDTWIDRM